MMMKRALLIFFTFLISIVIAQAASYYVKEQGAGTQQGNSWDNALDNIQTAINEAVSGDIVHVAAGTYYGGFVMKTGVTVLGGYATTATGTDKSSRRGPQTGLNQTILDGRNKERPLTQYNDSESTIETFWEGFVIQNGSTEPKDGDIITDAKGTATGVLFNYNSADKTGLMIHSKETTARWGVYGDDITKLENIEENSNAVADMNGRANTQLVIEQLGILKPAYAQVWCDSVADGEFPDWYLPACGELVKMYQQRTLLNKQLRIMNGMQLSDNIYWSSTELDKFMGWRVYFSDGGVRYDSKIYDGASVRPIRKFETKSNYATSTVSNGGGVHLTTGGRLRNCVIKNSKADYRGGGIYASQGARIEGCVVEKCQSVDGQGIFAENAVVLNCTVVKNETYLNDQKTQIPQVGYYYFSDGSWNVDYTVAKTLIGIVVYVNPINAYTGLIMHVGEMENATSKQAQEWAEEMNIDGHENWQIMTQAELQAIRADYKQGNEQSIIQRALLNAPKAKLFTDGIYWSETIGTKKARWHFNLNTGIIGSSVYKENVTSNDKHRVRLVRAFGIK